MIFRVGQWVNGSMDEWMNGIIINYEISSMTAWPVLDILFYFRLRYGVRNSAGVSRVSGREDVRFRL